MEYSEKVFREGIQIGEKRGEKRGEERGEKRGVKIGEKKGFEKGIILQISKLIVHGWSFDEAFDLIAKPDMDREDVRKKVAAMVSASRSSELHDNLGELPEDIQRQGPRGRGADG